MRKSTLHQILGLLYVFTGVSVAVWALFEWVRLKSVQLSFEDYGQFICRRADAYLTGILILACIAFIISLFFAFFEFYQASKSEEGDEKA